MIRLLQILLSVTIFGGLPSINTSPQVEILVEQSPTRAPIPTSKVTYVPRSTSPAPDASFSSSGRDISRQRNTSKSTSQCFSVSLTPNTPTGIAGCWREGVGIASHYGPGTGVAMNFCTWTLRHTEGCGSVRVESLDTGRTVVVPVVDFCDCYTGTPDERIVDLQYGVVAALGLDLSRGLYKVKVTHWMN